MSLWWMIPALAVTACSEYIKARPSSRVSCSCTAFMRSGTEELAQYTRECPLYGPHRPPGKDHWMNLWWMILALAVTACSGYIKARPSSRASCSCTAFMMSGTEELAQFTRECPLYGPHRPPGKDHWMSLWWMIHALAVTSCSGYIKARPSSRASCSCTAFMRSGTEELAQFTRECPLSVL